ncbi:MAG: glutamate-5-semialdehyde dehydrogenase [SAR324 cluster bacterium]|nr:glutamate-5-semialdehyde dehydrogenase [SAR324 cluster bacterium]
MTRNGLVEQAQVARQASITLANLSTEQKNQMLLAAAAGLRRGVEKILSANQLDLGPAQAMVDRGELSSSAYQRLILNRNKIEQMALNMESVAQLPDPVGTVLRGTRLAEDLDLYRVSCPIGVLLVIYESRPEVTVQISALAIKSGNAVILKGGSEVTHSNQILAEIILESLSVFDFMPVGAVQMLNTREEVSQLLESSDCIDLIIPRGSNALVRHIQAHSKAPVLAHADGICHVYLDESADPEKSEEVVIDAKIQYPAVCNAMETLLVHEKVPESLLIRILEKLQKEQVELRVCEKTARNLAGTNSLQMSPATEEDWRTEYTDLILSVKTVASLEEAVSHINTYGSKHTDSIVTENKKRAEWFMNQVDAAGVFWNASTRFADGFRYGFGAEVGVSTSKTHARGPVGLEGLVIYKYKLYGHGQGVARYEGSENTYLHEAIDLQ